LDAAATDCAACASKWTRSIGVEHRISPCIASAATTVTAVTARHWSVAPNAHISATAAPSGDGNAIAAYAQIGRSAAVVDAHTCTARPHRTDAAINGAPAIASTNTHRQHIAGSDGEYALDTAAVSSLTAETVGTLRSTQMNRYRVHACRHRHRLFRPELDDAERRRGFSCSTTLRSRHARCTERHQRHRRNQPHGWTADARNDGWTRSRPVETNHRCVP
jgi:hypothetical protein